MLDKSNCTSVHVLRSTLPKEKTPLHTLTHLEEDSIIGEELGQVAVPESSDEHKVLGALPRLVITPLTVSHTFAT